MVLQLVRLPDHEETPVRAVTFEGMGIKLMSQASNVGRVQESIFDWPEKRRHVRFHRHMIHTSRYSIVAALILGSIQALLAQSDGCVAVLNAAKAIPGGGGYTTTPKPPGGSPVKVVFKGEVLRERSTNGTYCSGFTFAVLMEAAKQRGQLEGKSVQQMREFRTLWYGADTNVTYWEKQAVLAMEKLKIGLEIPWREAKPGDFVQMYRRDSLGDPDGHSAVFLGFLSDQSGEILGIKFRSSQTATKGIGDAIAYFTDAHASEPSPTFKHTISRRRIYVGRLN